MILISIPILIPIENPITITISITFQLQSVQPAATTITTFIILQSFSLLPHLKNFEKIKEKIDIFNLQV